MKTFDPQRGYALSEYAVLIGSTPTIVRKAADRKLIPGAFRPYAGAHWKISGAALNDVVAKLKAGTTVAAQEKAQDKKRRRMSEDAALAGLAAAV